MGEKEKLFPTIECQQLGHEMMVNSGRSQQWMLLEDIGDFLTKYLSIKRKK